MFLRKSKKIPKFLLVFACLSSLFLLPPESLSAEISEVHVIKINGDTINPVTAGYIIDSIDKAYHEEAECLVIELDTPGGLLTSTRLIVKKIMSAKIPVIVYIYPSGSRAGSAGVFITYASHIAAMAPSTNIGAAHPVQMGGRGRERSVWDAVRDLMDSFSEKEKQSEERQTDESKETDVMGGKILHDTVAFIKALANERNRNVEWAEKSVAESASITEEEALKNNVIEIIAKDEKDLLNKLDGMEVKIGD
ncbi:MAG: nodulation protein NfeD, partial [Candidatus Omnitrophota bacterium]|nr:nodulation protein NfeD [Candidatus Omnitrophota bacterium]